MKIKYGKIIIILLSLLVLLAGCGDEYTETITPIDNPEVVIQELDENGYYTSKEEVSLYINTFGKLPGNYITKREATNLGWDAQKGNLWDVTESLSIGGDRFGNREKLLPEKDGRIYYECDINYEGGYRGSERLVYSNDGLIFYTGDHYESFEQLY